MKFRGPYQTAITVGVIVVLVIVLYVVAQKLGLIPEDRYDTKNNVEETAEGAVPTDGSSVAEIEESFQDEAFNFANSQYAAMEPYGTDEETLMYPLTALTGAQLVMVYQAFGVRDGKNLFQWYASELDSWTLTGGVWFEESIEGCSGYFDNCSQIEAMRGIWAKSGLPITF